MRKACTLLAFAAAFSFGAPASAQSVLFTADAEFDSGTLNNVVHLPHNQLQLGPTAVSKTRLVWVDNYLPGWILRIDSQTGRQTARFDSALEFINGQPTGGRPSQEVCNWSNRGNCPGRVAVDTNGDVWIVNRAFGNQGTLSKFSGDISHCIDRNNNGVIDTSRDANDDGIVDPTDPQEYLGASDECILATIPVGALKACPRSVAVDKKGRIWVGTCNGSEGGDPSVCTTPTPSAYRFNPNEPVALEKTVALPQKTCLYSAAAGGDYVFFSDRFLRNIIRIHIDTLQVEYAPCKTTPEPYGIVADPGGGWAWAGALYSSFLLKATFAGGAGSCTPIAAPSTVSATTLDRQGNVWAAGYGGSSVHKFNPQGVLLGSYPTGGNGPHGISVDFDGNIWSVQDSGAFLVKLSSSGANLGSINITGPNVGVAYTPYLYSDFTGVQIDRLAPYTRVGVWEATHDGGAPGIPWSSLTWNVEPEGTVPTETALTVSARGADSLAQLATIPYVSVAKGLPIVGVQGRYVQVKADFLGPGYKTPVLSDLTVFGPCSTVGESCCTNDTDCDDLQPCSQDTCPAPGGTCQHTPVKDCCHIDPDCNDANPCTVDTCVSFACSHSTQAGCCLSNSDCDDGQLCTADLCSGLGGSCSSVLINGCCMTDVDCTKGNPCSVSTCPSPGGLCDIKYKQGCCQTASDCADTDPCTADVCELATQSCSNTKIAGCCSQDTECFDGDDCTVDHCSGPGGQCVFSSLQDCCSATSPEIGKPCDAPESPFDQPPCAPGHFECNFQTHQLECKGAIVPESKEETCDGKDNNCDGNIDENACPQGTTCLYGVCAKACGTAEFPCDPGYVCKGGVCLPVDCSKLLCPPGTSCVKGDCVGPDSGVGGSGGAAGSGGASALDGATGPEAEAGDSDGKAGMAGVQGQTNPNPGAQKEEGGCSCRAAGESRSTQRNLWFVSVAVILFARRRRSRS